jgi:hypothetical protein
MNASIPLFKVVMPDSVVEPFTGLDNRCELAPTPANRHRSRPGPDRGCGARGASTEDERSDA